MKSSGDNSKGKKNELFGNDEGKENKLPKYRGELFSYTIYYLKMSSGEKCRWWPTASAKHSFVSGMVFELFCSGLTTITTGEAQLVLWRQKCSNPLI